MPHHSPPLNPNTEPGNMDPPSNFFTIRYEEGNVDGLSFDIQRAFSLADTESHIFIVVFNCLTVRDSNVIESVLENLGIRVEVSNDLSNGTFTICQYNETSRVATLYDKFVELCKLDSLHKMTLCDWIHQHDGYGPALYRTITAHFICGQSFEPFLSSVQRIRFYPIYVAQHSDTPYPEGMDTEEIEFVLTGSFFICENCMLMNARTRIGLGWDLTVDSLFRNLLEHCLGTRGFDPGVLKATFAVLLFKLWFQLRQRNDTLKLLSIPITTDALSNLIANFTSRYIPAALSQVDSPEPVTVNALGLFQRKHRNQVAKFEDDRNHLLQRLYDIVDVYTISSKRFEQLFNSRGRAVFKALRQMNRSKHKCRRYTVLEPYAEPIFELLASLTKPDIDSLIHSMTVIPGPVLMA